MARGFVESDPLSPEAQQAIASREVEKREKSRTGSSYYCNICKMPVTGEKPLNQHVGGKEHAKSQKRAVLASPTNNQIFPDTPNMPPVLVIYAAVFYVVVLSWS